MKEIIKVLDDADERLRDEITKIAGCPRQTATMDGNMKLLLEARSLLQEAVNNLLAQRFVT